MKIKEPRLQELFDYLSKLNQTAYRDEWMLANDVLAKDPTCGDILNRYFSGNPPLPPGPAFQCLKLLECYGKNLVWFATYLLKALVVRFLGSGFKPPRDADDLVLIDSFFLCNKIAQEQQYQEIYFPGLEKVLKEKGRAYAFTPQFSQAHNPRTFWEAFKVLKKSGIPLLTEFHVLRGTDYLRALLFLFFYPWRVMRLARRLPVGEPEPWVRFALWDTLDRIRVSGFLRLLYGRRLSRLPFRRIQCISWFENQSTNKCFYRGLRHVPGKVFLQGAQFFIWPPTHLNIHVDPREIPFGVVPDVVLVNGPFYLEDESPVCFKVGLALRYQGLFTCRPDPRNAQAILVVMSYWEYEIETVLDFLRKAELEAPLIIRFHPNTNVDRYLHRLPPSLELDRGDRFRTLERVRLIVGAASGLMVEGASLGIPVLAIVKPTYLSHNYFPDLGRGLLWDRVEEPEDLKKMVERFGEILEEREDEVQRMARQYRELFFAPPREEDFARVFELS